MSISVNYQRDMEMCLGDFLEEQTFLQRFGEKKKADTIYKQLVERKNGPVRGNSKGRDVAARK